MPRPLRLLAVATTLGHRQLRHRRRVRNHLRRPVLALSATITRHPHPRRAHLRPDPYRPFLPRRLLMTLARSLPLLLAATGCFTSIRTSLPDGGDAGTGGEGGRGGAAGLPGRGGGGGIGGGQAGVAGNGTGGSKAVFV